jgi:uncharacterized membrane protein HdeD (DUF308 family)
MQLGAQGMARAAEWTRSAFSEIAGKWAWFAGLGGVLLLFAAMVFMNISATTMATTWLIGFILLLGGAVQLVQALFTDRWSRSATAILGGALYVFGGAMIMREPAQGSILITILVMIALSISGVVRIGIALAHRDVAGWWVVLIGGITSIAVGVMLLASLPWSGTWVLGMLIGVELAVQGISWLAFGLGLRRLRQII